MSKISNPAGAVRVLRSTMAKMAADYKALERKLARVTATKDREFDARVKLERDLADERVISGVFRALVGSYPPFEPNGDAIMEARDTIQRFTGVHAAFFDDAVRIGLSHAASRGIEVKRGSGDPRRYMRECGA